VTSPDRSAEHLDVVIVGAGLSGIGAACHLARKCPQKTFAILEARDRIGGTWDLFCYPGVRSDSDMFTLGYSFRPWTGAKSIVDGRAILQYIRETAHEHGIDRKIRLNHRLVRASWSSSERRWTIEAEQGIARERAYLTCNFILVCSGYYSYAEGYKPSFHGIGDFKGLVIHPQDWTTNIDCANKRVVVIGSGATAVTLVPALAKEAAHVTMLQRSPSYIVAWPDEDRIANALRRWLPAGLACGIARWKNALGSAYFFRLCRRNPERAKRMILEGVRAELGPSFDVGTHFTPRYNPWDQRLCLAPNGDFFQSIRQGRASIVTDDIKTFTEAGLELNSGRVLEADLVVTATGLNLQVLGGAEIDVDGRAADPATTMSYKGALYSDIPNLASVFGYTNASWTLKADLISDYVCRLLNYMVKHGYDTCTPRNTDPTVERLPPVDFSSGYFQRAMDKLPRQGSRKPWRIHQSYLRDIAALRFTPLGDGVLEFTAPPGRKGKAPAELAERVTQGVTAP
jgi:cation diffusion facilitator CzcD-associated flavoprotein CzcO